jgi:hypothetical protein
MARTVPSIRFQKTPTSFLKAVLLERLGHGAMSVEGEGPVAGAEVDVAAFELHDLWLRYCCAHRVHPAFDDKRLERGFIRRLAMALRHESDEALARCREACLTALDAGYGPVLAGVNWSCDEFNRLADEVEAAVRQGFEALELKRWQVPNGGRVLMARWHGPQAVADLVAQRLARTWRHDDVMLLSGGQTIVIRAPESAPPAAPVVARISRPRVPQRRRPAITAPPQPPQPSRHPAVAA